MSGSKQNEEKHPDDDLTITNDTKDDPLLGGLDDLDNQASPVSDDGNKQDQTAKDDESVKFEKAIKIAQEKIANNLEKEERMGDIDISTNKTKSNDAKKYQFDEETRKHIDSVKDDLIGAAKAGTAPQDAVNSVTIGLKYTVKSLDKEKRNLLANEIVNQFHVDKGIVIHFVLFFCIPAPLVVGSGIFCNVCHLLCKDSEVFFLLFRGILGYWI